MKNSIYSDNYSAGEGLAEGGQRGERADARNALFPNRDRVLERRIGRIFMAIGIPPQNRGYRYLRESVKFVVRDEQVMNRVTKELYPKVAAIYDTTASKVERAIRHSIEVAWKQLRTDTIGSVFGAKVYLGNTKPTNSEFIALVAEKLLYEDMT